MKEGQPRQGKCLPPIAKKIGPKDVQQERPSNLGTVPKSLLQKGLVIHLNIEVVDSIHQVPLPKKLCAQIHAELTLKIDERHVTLKASHPMEIIGSHHHLPTSNMDGVGSVPPPFGQELHQDGTNIGL